MAPVTWPADPVAIANDFEQRRGGPGSGALILFGVWAAESLYYLADIDAQDDLSQPTVRGYRPDVVDVAHARWGTGTCVTALDLCAAGLGRALGNHTAVRELSIADFTASATSAGAKVRRCLLPTPALHWIDGVADDRQCATIKAARNALTHARVRRHFSMPRERIQVQAGDTRLDVPTLLAYARDTATEHILRLLHVLPLL